MGKQKLLAALHEVASKLHNNQIGSTAGADRLEELVEEFEELRLGPSSENVLNADHVSGSVLQHHAGNQSDPYAPLREIIAHLRAQTITTRDAGDKLPSAISGLASLTATPTHSNRINSGHVSGNIIQIGGGTVNLEGFRW